MKRAWVLLLLFTSVAVPVVALDAVPASACSCAVQDDRGALAYADAVFVGEVQDYEAPEPMVTSADPAVWTFRVREVYKGDVARIQPVVSQVSGASCGLEIPKHGEFLVFANTPGPDAPEWVEPGELHASLCGGTRPATMPLEGAREARAPTRATVGPDADDSGTPAWRWPLVVGGAVVALGAGVAVLLRRGRRAPSSHH